MFAIAGIDRSSTREPAAVRAARLGFADAVLRRQRQRDHPGRGAGLLLLHRLRHGDDDGRGVPSARSATSPSACIGALAIGTVIYVVTAVVLVGVVPWRQVDENQALAAAVAPLHNWFVNAAIIVGVLAGTTSVAIGSLLGQTRIFYVMARDRMLPPFVAKRQPAFQDADPDDDDHRRRASRS